VQLDLAEDVNEAQWSRDGRWLVFRQGTMPVTDIGALRPGVDSVPTTLVGTSFTERAPALSPDGRWLSYVSDESGRDEVYVRPFPEAAQAKYFCQVTGLFMKLLLLQDRSILLIPGTWLHSMKA